MERVIAYIDGFNLYYGLKAKRWQCYYWLDIRLLILNLLKPHQRLCFAKYFTARISGNPEKERRQSVFLDAIGTLPDTRIYYGHFLPKQHTCRDCGTPWNTYEEKMTDVNIAVELMLDAHADEFDTAMIISGDSDLTAPIKAVRSSFASKRVVIAFPPQRQSKQLESVANASFMIGRKKFADSQFPDGVTTASGYVLRRPESWR